MSLVRPVLLALALALPLAAPARAGDADFRAIADQLALSADQRARVELIVYQSKSARVTVQAQLERARLDLRHHLAADPLDEKAVRKAVADLNAATAALVDNRVNEVIELRKVLDRTQFEKLSALWGERRRDRWGDEDEGDDD